MAQAPHSLNVSVFIQEKQAKASVSVNVTHTPGSGSSSVSTQTDVAAVKAAVEPLVEEVMRQFNGEAIFPEGPDDPNAPELPIEGEEGQ